MVMGYCSVAILFWQLLIDHIVNVLKSYIKDVDLPRHAWDTPPFLTIVSPTPPVQSVDAYVRTYVRSVNHVTTKRKEVDHIPWVWGSVPRARGSPTIKNNCFRYPDILGEKCICIVNIVIFKTIGCHVNTREETALNKSLCKQENEKPLYSACRNSIQTLHCILKQLMTT